MYVQEAIWRTVRSARQRYRIARATQHRHQHQTSVRRTRENAHTRPPRIRIIPRQRSHPRHRNHRRSRRRTPYFRRHEHARSSPHRIRRVQSKNHRRNLPPPHATPTLHAGTTSWIHSATTHRRSKNSSATSISSSRTKPSAHNYLRNSARTCSNHSSKSRTSSPSSTTCSHPTPTHGASSNTRPTPTCQTISLANSYPSTTTKPPTGNQ